MREFAIGVISSLAATVVAVVVGWLGLSWPRRTLTRLLAKVTGTGLLRVYAQQKVANIDLAADLREARWVRVLAPRGNELTRDSFQPLWQGNNEHLESVQVLLPDLVSRWVYVREQELRQSDPGFEQELLAKQISANIDYLTAVAARNPAVALRLFDAPHTGRLVVTDRLVYLTLYVGRGHGRNSPCVVAGKGGLLYEHALEQFMLLWRVSSPPAPKPV
ncbi:hypothetical protein [Nonomuraea sp. NEAU-A123]|uniref:hypothetical protein n=1 Tax=Nonomuraea sp. NEAU-A123 TaxID=2839649 RepID=UPI001BE4ADE4|nr:hypothetical protein [Nonomuraea sp. NEAU-A123]MBT2235513.1 hypothetical protein [Nonomuraea sp. NEAU-A123]